MVIQGVMGRCIYGVEDGGDAGGGDDDGGDTRSDAETQSWSRRNRW